LVQLMKKVWGGSNTSNHGGCTSRGSSARVILEIPIGPIRLELCVFPFFSGLDNSSDWSTCMHFPRNATRFWGHNLPKFHKNNIESKINIFVSIWVLVPPTSMNVYGSLSRSMGSPCKSTSKAPMHFTIWVSYKGR